MRIKLFPLYLKVLALLVFCSVWIAGAAVGQFVLELKTFTWIMVWGQVAAAVAGIASKVVVTRTARREIARLESECAARPTHKIPVTLESNDAEEHF